MRDDQYSNETNDHESWVYINGELYHAGVKGMHWYQHLPGTDWWKQSNQFYYRKNDIGTYKTKNYVRSDGSTGTQRIKSKGPTTMDKVRANLYTLGQFAKNQARYYKKRIPEKFANSKIGKFIKDPKSFVQAYGRARWSDIKNFITSYHKKSTQKANEYVDSNTFLGAFAFQQAREAGEAYYKLCNNNFLQTFNTAIQDMQFDVVSGINKMLQKQGWDDDIDKFINKISGGRSDHYRQRVNREYKVSQGPNANERKRNLQQNRVR